ncbi:MAG: hypothetical protein JNM70_15835, partial [Anaerolineae bacterium]|nr:hypothetical protein [Anaerolineae bacterium]
MSAAEATANTKKKAERQPAGKKWVFLFDDINEVEKSLGSWDKVRALLGGKGSGLADMTRANVPVPPGFT